MNHRHQSDTASLLLKPLAEAGGELYEVGGPVRDSLLGLELKDHDILCRHLSAEKICSLLKPYGKVAEVGKSFGVIKFSPHRAPEIAIDIALPRLEQSSGTGHREFNVKSDPELTVEEDLGRRDFTINAMALALADKKIIDPFGGKKDLESRVLRMVFPKAFEEDPLRLVRAVQFAARFGLTIEPETFKAMCEGTGLIETVSGERVVMELVKLMKAPRPSKGFDLMFESGLLKHILPEIHALKGIEQDKQPGDDVYGHTMRALDATRSDPALENPGEMNLLFAILLHDIGKSKTARFHPPSSRIVFFGHQIASSRMALKWMRKYKLASCGLDEKLIIKLIENHMFETKASFTERAIRRFIAKIGKEDIFKLLDLRLADNRGGKHPYGIKGVLRLRSRIREEIAKKPPFGPKDLAINGHDLMALGIPEGPALGQTIKALVEMVLDEPRLNTKERLLEEAKKIKEK